MNAHDTLLDTSVLQQLVSDIGVDNTKRFLESLDNEFQKRINNIRNAFEEKSFAGLAAEAHALKSSAQAAGASRLAENLIELELLANDENEMALAQAQEALTVADLTRFAFLDVRLEE